MCEIGVRFDALGRDVNHAFHGPAREIHFSCMFVTKALFVIARTHARHKGIPYDATTHVVGNHEAQAAKHSLFFNVGTIFKSHPKSFR